MTTKKQYLKPDIVLKTYWNDNEHFADLFNAVLFNGRRVILAGELRDVDTDESTILEHREYAENLKAPRNSIKQVEKVSSAHGICLVLLERV